MSQSRTDKKQTIKGQQAVQHVVRRPGIEPGSKRWQRSIITTKYGSELASFNHQCVRKRR